MGKSNFLLSILWFAYAVVCTTFFSGCSEKIEVSVEGQPRLVDAFIKYSIANGLNVQDSSYEVYIPSTTEVNHLLFNDATIATGSLERYDSPPEGPGYAVKFANGWMRIHSGAKYRVIGYRQGTKLPVMNRRTIGISVVTIECLDAGKGECLGSTAWLTKQGSLAVNPEGLSFSYNNGAQRNDQIKKYDISSLADWVRQQDTPEEVY